MSTTADSDTGARQQELREAWAEVHGSMNDAAEQLLEQNPGYFARVLDFTAHAWRRGPLQPKVKALILLAVGLRQHIANAIRYGASPEELMEVFELASGIGVESFALALPALREAVEEAS
jgi:alkylhydroperoxidase/carboxymuconolactone decarboxylase family protein YurZ